jgi:hypothetical protein
MSGEIGRFPLRARNISHNVFTVIVTREAFMHPRTPRRWFAFALAATVLLTGLVLLSAQATETGLAPAPGPDDSRVSANPTATVNEDGSPVVDRLNTWAETKLKGKISAATGGGIGK